MDKRVEIIYNVFNDVVFLSMFLYRSIYIDLKFSTFKKLYLIY